MGPALLKQLFIRYNLSMPSCSIAIDQLLASLAKSARGRHQARLDPQTRARLSAS